MSYELQPLPMDEALGNVLDELNAAMVPIPFENSAYQNSAFVMAAQQTPGRAYRALLLRMQSKIQAIKHYKLTQERNAIDIEEKEAKIADPKTNDFDRRRLRLDILEIQDGKVYGEKLLGDALAELNTLYGWFKKFPRYTREQFEAEEVNHFVAKLQRQIEMPNGSQESLANMAVDMEQWGARLEDAVARLGAPESMKRISEG